ncbi:hypothetical protein [Dysgonomonas macrotermitis]|uniref:Uncharacterized protein n=1 Tax=Dysgonomonas macrotermitis TaxID=1346286 RepID=A0A1M4UAH3_9BACT|nr:hypothetical protein [Dysgonomonas macrotermitis]SHE53871.1 hypothetical protein SAMN05444362_101551 [Dysgonomonas macrotermitis]
MEFLKIKDYWTYQLPEWDNYEKEVFEKILSKLDYISIEGYIMAPEADIWKIEYKGHILRISNDLVHGCEIKTNDIDSLPLMEELIRKLPLE